MYHTNQAVSNRTDTPPMQVHMLGAVIDWHVRASPCRPHSRLVSKEMKNMEIKGMD